MRERNEDEDYSKSGVAAAEVNKSVVGAGLSSTKLCVTNPAARKRRVSLAEVISAFSKKCVLVYLYKLL